MGKVHELVAANSDARVLDTKINQETADTFKGRREHFLGFNRVYTSVDSGKDYLRDPEVRPLVTTVKAKLDYYLEQMVRVIDTNFQMEKSNLLAAADIIVLDENDNAILTIPKIPAGYLVWLEKRLSAMRSNIFNEIPTLDPLKVWDWDEKNGYFINHEPKKRITRKQNEVILMAAATDKHQAVSQLVSSDVTAGYQDETNICGMITPKQKSVLLAKLDRIIIAVKSARQRANDSAAATEKIAKQLFSALNLDTILNTR